MGARTTPIEREDDALSLAAEGRDVVVRRSLPLIGADCVRAVPRPSWHVAGLRRPWPSRAARIVRIGRALRSWARGQRRRRGGRSSGATAAVRPRRTAVIVALALAGVSFLATPVRAIASQGAGACLSSGSIILPGAAWPPLVPSQAGPGDCPRTVGGGRGEAAAAFYGQNGSGDGRSWADVIVLL